MENAVRYYSSLSRLADRTVGIENREEATIEQLNTLVLAEKIIARCIGDGIMDQAGYRELYQSCRQKLERLRVVAFID